MGSMDYNDANLQRLFAEMDVKHRLKALKGAFRREANKVKKTAINNLRGSIRTNPQLEKGVRSVVYSRAAGFKVTIAPKGKKKSKVKSAYWADRYKKIEEETDMMLIWDEEGTNPRKTKTKTKIWKRSRKSHSTGRIKRYGYMRKTRDEVKGSVETDLRTELVTSIEKQAKKYGCK